MAVLIVTISRDEGGVRRVEQALRRRAAPYVRLDTDRFPTDLSASQSIDLERSALTLTIDGRSIGSPEISAIWHRRFNAGGQIPSAMNPHHRYSAVVESQAAMWCFLTSLGAFALDPIPAVRAAEHKTTQLRVARACGMRIPKTLLTNEPQAVRQFVAEHPNGVVAKMLTPATWTEQGQRRGVFTHRLTPADLTALDGLQLSPMVFQEEIPKAREWRVTLVGRRAFCAAIESPRVAGAEVDWRRAGATDAWSKADLPHDVAAKLLKLTDILGLRYGAADLIETPQGEPVFLELNPGGEFGWIEQVTSLPIADAIADLLTHPPTREA